ncbi:MAG TPA: CHAT domain-containing protein [Thermoanaerobaculia bacterium]
MNESANGCRSFVVRLPLLSRIFTLLFLLAGILGPVGQVCAQAPPAAPKAEEPKKPPQANAIAVAQSALRTWRQVGDKPGQIKALLVLGGLFLQRSDIPKATDAFEEALKLAREIGERRGEAGALKGLGLIQAEKGMASEAAESHRRSLALWEELGDEAEQGKTLYNLGYSLQLLGETDQALEFYRRALRFREAVKDKAWEASALTMTARVHAQRGEVKLALESYEQALALSREAKDRTTEAAVLNALGRLYRQGGQLQKALEAHTQALGLNQDALDEPKLLTSLAAIYRDVGETEEALASYETALKRLQTQGNGPFEAQTLVEIGQIHLGRGNLPAALEHLDKGLALSRKVENPNIQALALHWIGVARLVQGEAQQALASLNQALALRREIPDRVGEAGTLLEIGTAEQALGNAEKAVSVLDRATDLSRQVQASPLEADALFRRARLDRDRGDLLAARDRMERALGLLESMRSSVASDRLRSSFLSSRRPYYDFFVDLLMRLDAARPGEGFAAAALAASERARARALLDLLAEGRIDVEHGIAPALKGREIDIGFRLSQVQRKLMDELSAAEPDEKKVAALREELKAVEGERERLEWQIRSEHPRYAEVRYPSPLRLPDVQALLDEKTALLEYSLGEEGSYLFVVTRSGFASYRLPPAGELAQRVREVRAGLEKDSRRTFGGYKEAAYQLYKALIAPAGSTVVGKRLLIAADGILHHLSFEALLTEEAPRLGFLDLSYLVKRHAVAYIPSASVLASLRQPRPEGPGTGEAPMQLLAFGDPVYGPEEKGAQANAERPAEATRGSLASGERWSWTRLEGSGREISEIARLYPPDKVKVYQREEANEENVKGNPFLARARRVHFATHGLLDEARPELSGLLLTRDARSSEDGILQVYEIFNLSLGAGLVVLSACETGGQEVTGEGLVGLTRAFLYAGASSVAVSLWRVADVSTPELMVHFYRHLDAGEDSAEALRRSKLEMIKDGGEHAHPYYWGPFIVVGAPK